MLPKRPKYYYDNILIINNRRIYCVQQVIYKNNEYSYILKDLKTNIPIYSGDLYITERELDINHNVKICKIGELLYGKNNKLSKKTYPSIQII